MMRNFAFFMALLALVFAAACEDGSKSSGGTPSAAYTVTFFDGVTRLEHLTRGVADGTVINLPDEAAAGFTMDGWLMENAGEPLTGPYTVSDNVSFYAVRVTEIRTAQELDAVRNNLSGNYRLAAGISLSAYSNWNPIGAEAMPFTGKLNGNGHKITDLKIDNATADDVGLFGVIKNGATVNLALENVDVKGTFRAGAIAGHIENSTVTGGYSTGKVTASASFSASDSYSGGIAGHIDNSTVTGCYSTGDVTASVSFSGSDAYSGGIAGRADNSTVTGCYSTGNVAASTSVSSSYAYSGGIAGYADNSTVTGCYSTGSIASSSSSPVFSYSGGIAGRAANSTVTGCHSTGDISSASAYSYSGGVVGYVTNSTITGCYSTGDITSSSSSSRYTYSGGIAGYVSGGTVADCYSTGNITSYSYSFSSYSGGIGGYVSKSTVTGCYSTGNISSSSSSSSYPSSSGGIGGHVDNSTVTGCAAINAEISAGKAAGRIVGDISSDAFQTSISNNFALNTMRAAVQPFNTDAGNHGVSKTEAQLKTQSTYSGAVNGDGLGGLGWKFGSDEANPWKMPVRGGYPVFYWQ